jgi:hypothetical protein
MPEDHVTFLLRRLPVSGGKISRFSDVVTPRPFAEHFQGRFAGNCARAALPGTID